MSQSPIADLSYRHYDGPLSSVTNRWWAIAKMTMQLGVKKKGFWLVTTLSAYWYMMLLGVLWFVDTFGFGGTSAGSSSASGPNPALQMFFRQFIWKDQFLNAFSISQLLLFVLALMLALGTIANDNRANALLIYLSKPCTKLDYIIGKWLGVFIPISLVSFGTSFLFYLYGLGGFREYGFLSQDPWLIVRLVFLAMIPGAVHASFGLGISSLFSQGRLAGATYAGLYFITNFFTVAMRGTRGFTLLNEQRPAKILDFLYYCSVDGLQIAMAKIVLNTDGSPLFPAFGNDPRAQSRGQMFIVPMPDPFVWSAIFFIVCSIGVLIAWSRVRAVEVVG